MTSILLTWNYPKFNLNGSPIDHNAVTLAFWRIIKRNGLKNLRINDLRRTYAALMLNMAGIHPKVISEHPGHVNIGITLDIYSHVLSGLQEAAAKKFARIYNSVVLKRLLDYVSWLSPHS